MAQNLILAECSAIFGQDIVKKATSDIMMPRYAGMFATKQALKQRLRGKSMSRGEYRRRCNKAGKDFQDEYSNMEFLVETSIKENGRVLWKEGGGNGWLDDDF